MKNTLAYHVFQARYSVLRCMDFKPRMHRVEKSRHHQKEIENYKEIS